MTAREVVDLIKKNVGNPVERAILPRHLQGRESGRHSQGHRDDDDDTFDMLKRANAAGLNMVITHEDTFWNDRDDTKDLAENPLYKLKTEYILKNDMVVWRDHDHMHAIDARLHGGGRASFRGHPAGRGRRACDDAPARFNHSGDDAGRVRRSSKAIERRARHSAA